MLVLVRRGSKVFKQIIQDSDNTLPIVPLGKVLNGTHLMNKGIETFDFLLFEAFVGWL